MYNSKSMLVMYCEVLYVPYKCLKKTQNIEVCRSKACNAQDHRRNARPCYLIQLYYLLEIFLYTIKAIGSGPPTQGDAQLFMY